MTQDQLIRYIQALLPMSPARAQAVAAGFHPASLAKNAFILRAGQVCSASHFVYEGILRSYA